MLVISFTNNNFILCKCCMRNCIHLLWVKTGAGRGKGVGGGGDNSIIYDKQVTQDFYVIICVDINIVI